MNKIYFTNPNESSIEEWAKWLDSQPKERESEKNELITFLALSLNEAEYENDPKIISFCETDDGGLIKVVWNRIKAFHDYTITRAAAVFIGLRCQSFGATTIYVNYLQYKAHQNKIDKIDLNFISRPDVFGLGLFTESMLTEAWNRQKIHMVPDNLLDHPEFMKSIRLKKDENTD